MDFYQKKVNVQELKISLITSENNISPPIHSFRNVNDGEYLMLMEKYPKTLLDLDLGDRIAEYQKIVDLVNNLHGIGIVHGDISEENIVIKDNDVRLIDFGLSEYIQILKNLSDINEIYGTDFRDPLTAIDNLKRRELDEVYFIVFGIHQR